MKKSKNPIKAGEVFTYLTVLEFAGFYRKGREPNRRSYYRVRCKCGKIFDVIGKNLRAGLSRSCGCLRKETLKRVMTKHGATRNYQVTPEYKIWAGIAKRCKNQKASNYSNYGGRGIEVCKRWERFENFLKDMGRRPKDKSLDRIDNDKGYCKKNCRWATRSEQNRNTRTIRYLEFNGQKKTTWEWAKITGLKHRTIYYRLRLGWSPEACLSPLYQERSRRQRQNRS